MKEKYFSYKYLMSIVILFTCLFLFSTTSLALIPGDFGSAGGGPPDGVVDFEDLMILSLAYSSTPSDVNWNEVCDIASQGGVLQPDGVIDFEDLMIFGMNYGEEEETIIPETTEIINEETEQAILSVSEDQSTMVLSHSTPQTDSIEVGDIIIMGITDQTPYGLLRKVTSIDRGLTKESQVILDTEFAILEEAIQKGHWEYDHTLKPEDIEKGFIFPEGIQPVRGKASTTLDFEYEINVILYDQDDNPTTTEDNIMATGYLAFNYQIIFDGDIDWHTLKYFIFKNIIETDSKLDISVGASVSIADLADIGDVTIGKPIPFTPVTVLIPTPIGIPIPLVFYPSIELKAGIEGEAHIVLETGVRQTASYTAGIEFTEGNWQNITTPPQIDYYEDPIEINGGIHIIAHAGPQLNCKLYKVAGPYCKIFGYLDFEADTTLDPWWDLDAMLKVLAGVELDIFSVHYGSDELELIKTPWFDIIDAGGPFGGTGPVHNLTKGTYYTTIQAALDDADSNNTIEVSDSTYDESITFPSGKKIILQSANGPSSTIIRGNDNLDTVTLNDSLSGTTLEGFTITHTSGLIGRGIYIVNSNININNCTISGNSAEWGSGIGICDNSTLTITGSTISGNSAVSGGGIYNYTGSTLTITGSTISDNSVSEWGGGIANCDNSTLTITGSTISGNSAEYSGGGIYNYFYTTLTIYGSTISDNSVSEWGGGIANCDNSTLTITGSTISGNSAEYNGGGIYIGPNSGTLSIGGSSNTDIGNFNEFIDNYKTGSPPSPDQHICDYTGDCHMDYPYNDYYPDNANDIIDGQITNVSPLTNPFDLDAWYTTNVYVKNTGNVSHNFKVRGLKPSGTDFQGGTEKFLTIDPGATKSVPFTYQFYGTETCRSLTFYLYDNSGNLLDTKQTGTLCPITLDAVITNIRDIVAGPLIDPFELNKWYTAVVHISVDYNGSDSGIIEVKPKPDSGIEYDPIVKEFPYDKYTLGGSRGFDYKFVGSGTTRQLTFELYDQATGDKLNEYTSETLHLMQPDPHLEYIESIPSSTNLQYLHPFNFPQDYVIKAHFDDGHIETWTDFNKFNFESSDIYIVNIHENYGSMYGTGLGTATITITYKEDTSKKAYLTVYVYE